MLFQKKIDGVLAASKTGESYQEAIAREEATGERKETLLEKGDLFSMVVGALRTFLPVVAVLLILAGLLILL